MPNLSDLIKYVTLTATQTLTNKTLTSPTLTAPTIDLANVTSAGDLAVGDGGTGASTAADARTNLGVAIGTNVQAYDAGLQSIAGLTTLADRMLYTTGSDVYAVTPLTGFARTLLDDVDAATARTTLGVVIGTNVQAYSANLDGWASIGTSAKQNASANLTTYASKTPPSGAVVGTTDTQTLTNKTITSATFFGDSNFDSTTMFVDASTNRVGFGTSTPTQEIDVEGFQPSVRVHSTNDLITATLTASTAVFVSSTDALVFNANSLEAARFDTSGRFLLGTFNSGASKLRIVGLPTSSSGLSSGDVWNDAGTLKIV